MNQWRDDFPILQNNCSGREFIYMDSSSTSLKPRDVLDAVTDFYCKYTSNVSRAKHFLSEEVFTLYEDVREKAASFINAKKNEIVFTHNCTDSINLVASGLRLTKDDEVIISILEHHSNFLPWHDKATVKIVNTNESGTIDIDKIHKMITRSTKLIAVSHISNVTGNIQPVKEIAELAQKHNVLCLVDSAQAAGHIPIDVSDIGCDFLAFSSHKMLGPSGVGVLYCKGDSPLKLTPTRFGGGMVNKIIPGEVGYMSMPQVFEAGTPNIEGILGFGAAIDYINKIGIENISHYLQELDRYCYKQLKSIDLLDFPFEISDSHTPIFTFRPKNPRCSLENLSFILSDVHRIAVRDGFQCAQPLYSDKKINGAIRASLYLYNTFDEIDQLVHAIEQIRYL